MSRLFARQVVFQAARENTAVRTSRSTRLIVPSTVRTPGLLSSAPAPAATAKAQIKSPVHAPNPTRHVSQNPPPRSRGGNPRRIISAFTGPGGQATDRPSTNPLSKIDIKNGPRFNAGLFPDQQTITARTSRRLRQRWSGFGEEMPDKNR